MKVIKLNTPINIQLYTLCYGHCAMNICYQNCLDFFEKSWKCWIDTIDIVPMKATEKVHTDHGKIYRKVWQLTKFVTISRFSEEITN